MDYIETINYIEEKNKLGSVLGLENIKELLKRLGNPETCAPVFHIAGTNGKGSIMTYVESALIYENYMVGRYISPTIFDYRERFQINKEYISKDDCAKYISKVAEAVCKMEEEGHVSPTSFEIETAAAFLYFKDKKVDVMLIECGMGGRLDATNVFGCGNIDILASVSRDHMTFLGDTVEKIAIEKLGIVKENDILVTYPAEKEVEKVISNFCKENKIQRFTADESKLEILKSDYRKTEFKYKNCNYQIEIAGDFQVLNAITAIEAITAFNEVCGSYNLHAVKSESIAEGLRKAEWPGRFSVIGEKPLFIADGAHNEDAWKQLSRNINKYFTKRNIVYIIGVLKDKEYERMLDYLVPTMKCAYTITPNCQRGFDGQRLADMISERKVEAEFVNDMQGAVRLAEKAAGEDGIVVACGSLSFIGDIIKIKRDLGGI